MDLITANPAVFPYTDIAWFSAECTFHADAGGRKAPTTQLQMFDRIDPDPEAERSRVTMWDVVRFSKHHRYQVVIVENVVQIKRWPPYRQWLRDMVNLGYDYKVCYFNSRFFHPVNGMTNFAPQNRDRIYIVFWRKGNRPPNLDFRPLAYCPGCDQDVRAIQIFKKRTFPLGFYDTTGKRGQYYYACPTCWTKDNGQPKPRRVEPYYYAAYNIIDPTIPCPLIGDRPKHLKPNTIRRIQLGLEKFGRQPLLVQLAYSHAMNNRTGPMTDPLPAQTTQQSLACIMPFKGEPEYLNLEPSDQPLPTLTTVGGPALVSIPFMIELYGGGSMRLATDALNTVTAGGEKTALLMPYLVEMYNHGSMRLTTDALNTVTSGGNKTGLLTTPFLTSYYSGSDVNHGVDEPVYTLTSQDRHSLVVPNLDDIDINACGFRVIEPQECKLGQGFDRDYIVLGNRRQQVRQIGNAVSDPVAEFLGLAGKESLA